MLRDLCWSNITIERYLFSWKGIFELIEKPFTLKDYDFMRVGSMPLISFKLFLGSLIRKYRYLCNKYLFRNKLLSKSCKKKYFLQFISQESPCIDSTFFPRNYYQTSNDLNKCLQVGLYIYVSLIFNFCIPKQSRTNKKKIIKFIFSFVFVCIF